MFAEEIIGKRKSHILRTSVAVRSVKIEISLYHGKRRPFGYIKIYAVAHLGDQALFGIKYIAAA